MFLKISQFLRWMRASNAQTSPPDWSKEQLSDLAELRSHSAWPLFQALLDKRINFLAEDLLRTSSTDSLRDLRGRIVGIREAALAIDELIAREEQRDRAQHAAADNGSSGLRAIATYGSPHSPRRGTTGR